MGNVTIGTFDDWRDYFMTWQKEIGLNPAHFTAFPFETKYGDLSSQEIEFGDFAGRRKWEKVIQIPEQRIRDGLLNMIVYQGDTEFASVEQQRNLFNTAPSDYDFQSLCRVMAEEMRHGWQMCHLLVTYFGQTGRIEARKQLERRSWKHNRLLGSFNEDVEDWLDFFTYTQFVDRDGKFQLKMLSKAAFAPLARSMGPMLKEEAFHLGTGNTGLQRIVKQGRIPTPVIQKYFNKWIPTAYDLFGKDSSSTAHWAYVWGIKGRFDEGETRDPLDKDHLNERSRSQYQQEVVKLVENLNRFVPEGSPKLAAPDMKFNRAIGDYTGQCWSVEGNPIPKESYDAYRKAHLPGEEEKRLLSGIFKENEWIQARGKE